MPPPTLLPCSIYRKMCKFEPSLDYEQWLVNPQALKKDGFGISSSFPELYHRHFQEPQQLCEMNAGSESLGQGQTPPVWAGCWPATASLLGSTNHPGIILKWDNALWAQTEALSSCCVNQTSDFLPSFSRKTYGMSLFARPPPCPVHDCWAYWWISAMTEAEVAKIPAEALWNRWLERWGAYCCLHQGIAQCNLPLPFSRQQERSCIFQYRETISPFVSSSYQTLRKKVADILDHCATCLEMAFNRLQRIYFTTLLLKMKCNLFLSI